MIYYILRIKDTFKDTFIKTIMVSNRKSNCEAWLEENWRQRRDGKVPDIERVIVF